MGLVDYILPESNLIISNIAQYDKQFKLAKKDLMKSVKWSAPHLQASFQSRNPNELITTHVREDSMHVADYNSAKTNYTNYSNKTGETNNFWTNWSHQFDSCKTVGK